MSRGCMKTQKREIFVGGAIIADIEKTVFM